MGPTRRHPGADARALAGGGIDLQRPPDQGEALSHPHQPEGASARPPDRLRVEADPVIRDEKLQLFR
jgi:hypothetical protein